MKNKTEQPKQQSTKGLWITICVLVTLLASLVSAGIGFYAGSNYAEGKQRQADARVDNTISALKVDASK